MKCSLGVNAHINNQGDADEKSVRSNKMFLVWVAKR